MAGIKSYIREKQEAEGDTMTTMEVWKSDLEFIRSKSGLLSARDGLHIMIEREKMRKRPKVLTEKEYEKENKG